jgi:pyridoxal phosphate enzyme (YggS family)
MIADNLLYIKSILPREVHLIAVSKTRRSEDIMQAYQAGQRAFGENRAMELSTKYPELPKDIEWHFIGHLQTNKVKYIAPFVHLVHSIDSLRLLMEVNKEARKNDRVIDCLLQFYIAKEESKFGLSREEAVSLLNSEEYRTAANIRIVGVMGMASFVEDESIIRKEFAELRSAFNWLKEFYFNDDEAFCECSMGMSHDYKIAIEEGSTMVRIGTAIFGERN